MKIRVIIELEYPQQLAEGAVEELQSYFENEIENRFPEDFTTEDPKPRQKKPRTGDLFSSQGWTLADPRTYQGIDMNETELGQAANAAADREKQEGLL
jgi:hypothetical protein